MTVKLSICIPTYNFGKFIVQTLESIIIQLKDNMEIVVLDGGSTDNTEEICLQFQKKFPQIRYIRQATRNGIGRDLDTCVASARGEYCWLFSADDTMEAGAIDKVLPFLDGTSDVCLCSFYIYDFYLKNKINKARILDFQVPTKKDLSVKESRREYFSRAQSTYAFFDFLSINIIKRERWAVSTISSSFNDSWWIHTARIFSMLTKSLTVQYLPLPLVRYRSDNDSFLTKGYMHRIEKAIDSYQLFAVHYFGIGSFEEKCICSCLRKTFSAKSFIKAKADIRNKEDQQNLSALIDRHYRGCPLKKQITKALVFFTPKSSIFFLNKAYRFLKTAKIMIFNTFSAIFLLVISLFKGKTIKKV